LHELRKRKIIGFYKKKQADLKEISDLLEAHYYVFFFRFVQRIVAITKDWMQLSANQSVTRQTSALLVYCKISCVLRSLDNLAVNRANFRDGKSFGSPKMDKYCLASEDQLA